MTRNRSRQAETEDINARRLKRGAIKRTHVDRWAIGRDELAPGVVDQTHLGPRIINETHIHPTTYGDLKGSAQLLVLSATGASIASGGAAVTFDEVVQRRRFDGVAVGPGDSWVHPIASDCWILVYEHAWTDGYDGGGVIRLEVDGVLLPEGVIADGDSGDSGSETIMYGAAAGSVGRIVVDSGSASSQVCDAVARIGVSDPKSAGSTIEWTKVFTGDVWGLHWDGTNWWTTEGLGRTVTKRDADWAAVSSFEADMETNVRGITMLDGTLWVCGDDPSGERLDSYSTAGALLTSTVTGGVADGNAGLTNDGTDLWMVENTADLAERYSTPPTLQTSFSIGTEYNQGIAYFGGLLYVVASDAGLLNVFTTAGAQVDSIDVSGAAANLSDVFIANDGTLYVTKDGDGVYRRSLPIGGL